MSDDRELLRSRVDLVELVSQTLPLKKLGKHFKGLCPFHPDRNPSLTVSSETGRYRCWACGETGDIFNWVMKTQNVDFLEAMRLLAQHAGIELSRTDKCEAARRNTLEEAMAAALGFFREQLPQSRQAMEYCRRRSLDPQVLDEWELGYAPELGHALADHLRRKGHSLAECQSLFLVDQEGGDSFRDKFRGRLMFPIRDERAHIVAFGGRIIGDGQPKYINSSDTPLFRKSRVLYGLYRSRKALNEQRQAVLVEGYLDVIACHRAGVENAVASLGTSLTEDHAKLLKRWSDEVVILYDRDDAGIKAADRAWEILTGADLKVRFAVLPQGDDPDTLLRRDGPEAVRAAVSNSLSRLDYRMSRLMETGNRQDDEFWEEAVSVLATASSDLDIERYLLRLAAEYPHLRDPVAAGRAIRRWVLRVKKDTVPTRTSRPKHDVEVRSARANVSGPELVPFLAFASEQWRTEGWKVARLAELYSSPTALALSEAIQRCFPLDPPVGPVRNWINQLEPDSARVVLEEFLEDIRAASLTESVMEDAFEHLSRKLEIRLLREGRGTRLEAHALTEARERLQRLKGVLDSGTEANTGPAQSDEFTDHRGSNQRT